MPEGDNIAIIAARLRPVLVGQEVVDVCGTAPSLRVNALRVKNKGVTSIRTFGKHLVIDLQGGFSIRVHLGMSGRWRVMPADRVAPGSARIALTTTSPACVLFRRTEGRGRPDSDDRTRALGAGAGRAR